MLRGTSFLKSKARTLGDVSCDVSNDAVTWLMWERKNVRAESARRVFGDEGGIKRPVRLSVQNGLTRYAQGKERVEGVRKRSGFLCWFEG